MIPIKLKKFDNDCGFLSITVCSTVKGGDRSIEAMLVDGGIIMRLKMSHQVTLVDEQYQFAASIELPFYDKVYVWKTRGLRMCLKNQKDLQPTTARKCCFAVGQNP